MGKLPIGPSALFRWDRSIGCGNRGQSHCAFRAPIRRGGVNFPNILRLVQRQTHQPVLSSRSERHTIRHPGDRSPLVRKLVNANSRGKLERLREPNGAACSIHNKSVTGLREVLGTLDQVIRAGICARMRVLRRAASRDVEVVSISGISVRIIRPKWESIGTCRSEMHTKVTNCCGELGHPHPEAGQA